tara:strand:- start:473 stop:1750 length:1278 start_codon:yes stop_codon:yes gene_type:complete
MKIGIIGLGYVGIQLAIVFARQHETIGFDVDENKLEAYRLGSDPTGEVSRLELTKATKLKFTAESCELVGCDIYIIAVPTPIDSAKNPDLKPLLSASRLVGQVLGKGSIVVYESTVYPGTTEEVCVPVLEESSGLIWREDFHVGYSPERINPGDQDHSLCTITKVVSADDDKTLETLVGLYGSVVKAGIHQSPSIRVAEAAKIIENTQRDLNIALVNELAVIFDRLGINTSDVLEAASTKWNFLPFRPGLVGGHCIGVDPYYLTHKAQMVNYHPEVILAGRRINDQMGNFIANKTTKLMSQLGMSTTETTINVFGVTFKENCADIRNSQVFDLILELRSFGVTINLVDPLADSDGVFNQSGLNLTPMDELNPTPVCILAVPHDEFLRRSFTWLHCLIEKPGLFIDVKSIYRRDAEQIQHLKYWSL